MTDILGCPEVTELHEWLLVRLPDRDAERLEQHLEQCAHCGQALDTLESEDALVPVIRARANIAGTRDEVVEQVMVRLKELYATADLPTGPLEGTPSAGISTGDEELGLPEDVTREVYAVLAGTEQAGVLGRLSTYRILKVLGAGGMGVVFQAEDEQLQRQVALKVIRPALAGSSGARQRFLAEARATAAIEHDHIVTIHQVGEDHGVLFLAMPLLKGETLEARLKREGKLVVGEVLRIGREVAEGLAAAHESKLIHRDIKPSNIWLEGKSGRVKILDFGLAQAMDDPGHLTRSGTVAGTPQYMAPEQADGSRVDARCDLFSLGCVLYRMATGTLPFRGANTMQLLRALERDQPRPPHAIDPEVPVALSELIMQLLAKDRKERPPHAHSVVETLQRLAALPQNPAPPLPHERAEAGKSQSLDQQGARTPMTTEVEIPSGRAPRRVRRPIVVAAVLVGIAGFGGGSFFYLQGIHTAKGDRPVAEEKALAAVPAPPPAEPPGEILCMRGHFGAVGPVACSADGRLALSGSWDNTMRLWDLATGRQLHCFDDHRGWVWSVAFSADGRRALSVGSVDRAVHLWDVETGKEQGSLRKHGQRFLAAAFLPDGPYALADGGDNDNTLRLWHVERGQEVSAFQGHTGRVWRVAFSPDGRRLLTGGRDKTARLWEVTTGREVQRFEGHASAVLAVALSPDGHRVLTGGEDGTLRLWDAESGQPLRRFEPHQGPIESVAFAPDGRRVLSGGRDKILRLWDVDSGQALCQLEGHTDLTGGVAFTPDGRRAISGGADGTVRLWRLPP